MSIAHTLPNQKTNPFGGVWSIRGTEQLDFVNNTALPEVKVTEFLDDYYNWCIQPHTIHGIEKYKYLNYANGTTEVFDKFTQRHMNRRLRLWKGEYFYHQIQAKLYSKDNFAWIDESPNNGK